MLDLGVNLEKKNKMICRRYHDPNLRVCDTLQHRQSLPWVIKAIVTVGDFKVEIKLVLARVDLLQGLGEPSSLHQRHHLAGASFQQVAMCFDLTTPCSSAQSDLAVKGSDIVAVQIQDLVANLTPIS